MGMGEGKPFGRYTLQRLLARRFGGQRHRRFLVMVLATRATTALCVWSGLIVLAVAGCTFDSMGLPRGVEPDRGARDVAPQAADSRRDKAPPDQTLPDKTLPDKAPPPDKTLPPDKKPPPPLPSCKKLFGSNDGYKLCQETATTCRFFHDEGIFGGYYACDNLCKPGTCIKAQDTQSWDKCGPGVSSTCAKKHYSSTCTCTKK